jgi:Xaa-Pro aminopeptidase
LAEERLAALRRGLAERGVDAVLVAHAANRRYLSGFTGSSGWLLISEGVAALFTDGRYTEQAQAEAGPRGFRVENHGRPYEKALAAWLRDHGVRRLGLEANHTSHAAWERYRAAFEGVELVAVDGLVESLRRVKTAEEVAAIAEAARITDEALAAVLPMAAPGVCERDLALEIEWRMRKAGAEAAAFDFIVASGPRSALPHGRASDKALAPGELLTFDLGARVRGYASDITRTYFVKAMETKARELYDVVLAALEAGVAAVRPGALGRDVDRAARSVIDAAGYGDAFSHGTGHGVGLEVHEAPSLNAESEDVLEEGMVVTVEPGIYVPGFGGVRLEETVVVTAEGPRRLTRTPLEKAIVG